MNMALEEEINQSDFLLGYKQGETLEEPVIITGADPFSFYAGYIESVMILPLWIRSKSVPRIVLYSIIFSTIGNVSNIAFIHNDIMANIILCLSLPVMCFALVHAVATRKACNLRNKLGRVAIHHFNIIMGEELKEDIGDE